MLVEGDFGSWLRLVVAVLLVVIVQVMGFLARWKWRCAVARSEEIERLAGLAAEEAARAELDVKAGYSYGYVDGYGYGNGYGSPAMVDDHMSEVSMGPTEVEVMEVPAVLAPVGNLQSLLSPCAVCSRLTKSRCKQCKAVHYCSGKCQIDHWRQGHKDKCRSYSTVYHNNDLGVTSHLKVSKEEEENGNYDNGSEMEGYHSSKSVAASSSEHSFSNSGFPSAHGGKNDVELEHFVDEKGRHSNSDFTLNSYSGTSAYTGLREPHFDSSHMQTKPLVSEYIFLASSIDSTDTVSMSSQIKLGSVDADKSRIPSASAISGVSDSVKSSLSEPSTSSSGFWEGKLVQDRSRVDAPNDTSHFCSSEADESKVLYSKSSSSEMTNIYNPRVDKSNANNVALDDSQSQPVMSETRKTADGSNISVGGKGDIVSKKSSKLTPETMNYIGDIGSSAKPISTPGGLVPPASSARERSTTTAMFKAGGVPSSSIEKLNSGLESRNSSSHKLESRKVEPIIMKVFEAPLSADSERHAVGSVKAVKSNGAKGAAACLLELDGRQQNGKNGFKTSVHEAVHQLKTSTLTRQNTLGVSSETVARYKGLFPYDMFVKLYHWNKFDFRPSGLVNCGNSCYANVVLQCLAFTPPLNAYLLQGFHSKSCERNDWCFTCELESLLLKVKEGLSPLTPIRIISHLQKIGSHLNDGTEEDAHEFLRLAIDMMQSICLKEARVKESGSLEEGTTLIGLTFGGYLRSKIECMSCGGKSVRIEKMMDLTVEIDGDIGTLEEALKQFTSAETLDGDNKYQCGSCKSYEKAIKKLKVIEAPNVLSIVLKRFQSGRFGKLNKTIKFPEILNLAPYMRGTSDKSPIYHLYGVVVHLDTMNAAFSGHYVCYVKNLQNKWFQVDDSRVKPVELDKVLSKGAYMLLYARCSPRAPRLLRSSLVPRDPRNQKLHISHNNYSNGHPGNESTNSNHTSLKPRGTVWEDDSFSDNSSYFSEVGSYSTDSSRRDSTSIDDQVIDRILGEMGICCNSPWTTTSSDSDTSSSSSPTPVFSRQSPLAESDRYASGGRANNREASDSKQDGNISFPNSTKQFRNLIHSNSSYRLGRNNPFEKVKYVVTSRRSTSDRPGRVYL